MEGKGFSHKPNYLKKQNPEKPYNVRPLLFHFIPAVVIVFLKKSVLAIMCL